MSRLLPPAACVLTPCMCIDTCVLTSKILYALIPGIHQCAFDGLHGENPPWSAINFKRFGIIEGELRNPVCRSIEELINI